MWWTVCDGIFRDWQCRNIIFVSDLNVNLVRECLIFLVRSLNDLDMNDSIHMQKLKAEVPEDFKNSNCHFKFKLF